MGGSNPETAATLESVERTPAAPVKQVAQLRARLREAPPDELAGPESDLPSDRRSGERRSALESGSRSNAAYQQTAKNSLRRHYVLPSTLPWMALGTLLAFTIAGFVSLTLPTTVAVLCAVLGTAIAAASRFVIAWERAAERNPTLCYAIGGSVIVLTALLAGSGMGHWMYHGGLDVRLAIAAVVSFNAVFATVLSGRTGFLFLSKLACWLPIVAFDANVYAFAGFALATLVAAAVARHQAVADRKRAENEEARARVRDRAQSILADYEETGQGWFWETDRRGQLTYLSKSVVEAVGRRESDLLGRPFTNLFELADDDREGERTLTFHLSARSSFQELAVRGAVPDEERWWSINGRPLYDSFENFCGFRGSGTDLTERKRSQENATRLAQYDSLTGLANRLQMAQTLEKILESRHERQRECSIMLLDLDRFKHVNDTLGHPAGDALLQQVAQRLECTVGQQGRCGRLGGDEFKVIIPGRTPPERLAQLAQEIIHALSHPYTIDGQRVVIGASIGISIAPENGMTSESVVRNADLALYAAKDAGRGRYHFYSRDLHSKAEERSELEHDLRDAITNGELQLFYQPVVDTSTEQIAGFEALLRWHHARHGWLSPEKFIPIAEDTGLIVAIGEWALRTACQDLARWPQSVRCAVNVSPLQFGNPQFPAVVTNAISQAGIHPARLELEITESVFLDDDQGIDTMFAALKRIGVRLALDDFGTGYSSLGYLKRAPFDKIKIDQSFVHGAAQPDSHNGAIIASITSLAQSLDMETTAEGVETLDELDLVRMHGCSHVQGYVYSKPLSGESANELLAKGLTVRATGPKSSRPRRQKMLRKVVLEHQGQAYQGTIRNMSRTGALVEGLWNVPAGTEFSIALSDNVTVGATARWNTENRTGMEFAQPLETEDDGSISLLLREKLSIARSRVARR